MDKEIIRSLAQHIKQSYTPEEMELMQMCIAIGARNHRQINRHPDDWYERRDLNRPTQEECDAFAEYAKKFTGLGDAVENIRQMKTYEEVEEEVLTKLMWALVHDEEKCNEYFECIMHLREIDQNNRTRKTKKN